MSSADSTSPSGGLQPRPVSGANISPRRWPSMSTRSSVSRRNLPAADQASRADFLQAHTRLITSLPAAPRLTASALEA